MLEKLGEVDTPLEGLKILFAGVTGIIALFLGIVFANYFYKFLLYGLACTLVFSPIILIAQGMLKTWGDIFWVSALICFLGGFVCYPFLVFSEIGEKVKQIEKQGEKEAKYIETSKD